MTGDGSEREELETPLSPAFPSAIVYTVGVSSEVPPPFPIPDVDPTLTVPVNVRNKRLFPRTYATGSRSRPPNQCMAVTSSSSGGASSRASSRSRARRKSQGLHPVARKKNTGGSGPTKTGMRPVAKGAESVPISMPIPIIVSDAEDPRKSAKKMKDVAGADAEMDAYSGAPSLNKRQKISSSSSNSESGTMPAPKRRLAAPQKPIRVTRSTSSGMSASSNVGKKRVGLAGSGKSAVRTARVGGGGAGNASESRG